MSSLNYLSWSLLPSMKKTGVSSRHLTQLRIYRGALLGKKMCGTLWHMGSYWLGMAVRWFVTPISWSRSCALWWPQQSAWKLYTPEEKPSLDQSVLVQLHPDLVSIDTSTSYSPKFNQKENINSFEQNFSSLAKLPVIRQCCWICKTQEGFLHTEKTSNRSSADWRCQAYCTGSDEPPEQSCSPAHGRLNALIGRGQTWLVWCSLGLSGFLCVHHTFLCRGNSKANSYSSWKCYWKMLTRMFFK